MNFSEMRTLLKRLLDEEGVHRTDEMLNDSMNIGYILLSTLTQASEYTETIAFRSGEQFRELRMSSLIPIAVYWNGTRLLPVRMSDLDELSPSWLSDDAGTPVYYFTMGTQTPNPQLWIHPRPDEDGRIRITHAIIPDTLTHSMDIPRIPSEYHNAIVLFAYAWELLKEREPLIIGKAFRVLADFSRSADTLRDYVYRRTPDRDWEMMPWDAEAFRQKLHDFEQRAPSVTAGVEMQLVQQ